MLDILAAAAAKAITLLGVVIPFRPKTRQSIPQAAKASSRRSTKQNGPSAMPGFIQPEKPLSSARHFEKVAAVIAAAIQSARIAAEAHESTRIQLEVVEFSIDRILDEVASVMTLTPAMAAIVKPMPVAVPLRRVA